MDERRHKLPTAPLRTGLVALGLLALACAGSAGARAEIDASIFDDPKPVAAFSLRDHKGQPFGLDRLTGQWTLVLLGYTYCPDVCPFTLSNMALVMEQLGFRMRPGSLPKVLFVGVDPDRDAEALADYMPNFQDDFIGATGRWDEIKRLVESLDGFVRLEKKTPDDDAYLVRHSANISLIDPDGRLKASLNPPLEPNQTADFLAKLFREYRRKEPTTN